MKSLKLKAAAAAVAFALAAPAQAAITNSNTATGSSLFLTVWNSTTSYVRDLGLLMSDVLNANPDAATAPNSAWVSEAGFTFTSLGDSLFASMFGGNLTGTQWSIVAGENITQDGTHLVATIDNGVVPTYNTTVTNNASAKVGQFGQAQNNEAGFSWVDQGAPGTGDDSCNFNNSCATTNTSGGNFGGSVQWGPNLGTTNMPDTTAEGSEAINFWFANSGSGGLAPASHTQFKNSANPGLWTLAADGTATYTLAAAVAPIPLPGAVWLLASGLLGFGAVARRRKQQA